MTDLASWLLAQIADDEAAARTAEPGGWHYELIEGRPQITGPPGGYLVLAGPNGESTLAHIARHDPARVLAEVAAKRRIVELHADIHECVPTGEVWPAGGWANEDPWIPCPTLRLLAQPYADHEDFQEEWRV